MRRIFTLSIALSLFTFFAKAQDQITNTGGTSITVSGVSTKAWDNPPIPSLIWQNVRVPDDFLVAGVSLVGGQRSDFLVLSNFNFNIPLNYRIDQIIVDVYGNASRQNTITIPYLQLINATPTGYTPIAGSNSKTGFVRYDLKSSTQTYGSSCSQFCYWNTNLGPAEVNDPTFGLVIQFENSSNSPQTSIASMDYITITLVLAQRSPLPVNFTNFSGKKIPTGTQLTWNVSEEKSVKFYNVEKSTNGILFKNIGMVRATGDSYYTFTDVEPEQPAAFYRIQNVDMDERYKYSTVLSFRKGKAELLFKAFPTIVRNSFTLQHAAINNGAKIDINAADGRLIKSMAPSGGSIQTQIDLSRQMAGVYIVRFDNGKGKVETVKIVKQ